MLRIGYVVLIRRSVAIEEIKNVISLLKPVPVQGSLVRVGGNTDGGYLIPDDLYGIKYCFSPGVSSYAPFEIELEGMGIKSFLADHSVDGAPPGLKMAEFVKKFLGPRDSGRYMAMSSWLKDSIGDYPGDLILQMDIEGSEYGVLANMQESDLSRFRIVVVEFHGLHGMFDRMFLEIVEAVFTKLLNLFYVVHVHPNNFSPALQKEDVQVPDVLEVTFLRRDRAINLEAGLSYPHSLDQRCSPIRGDYPLPACWHSGQM